MVKVRFYSIWAIEIAEDPKLNANVTAFDISDKFFPPATWLPRNLTLRLQDILHPFPDDLLGMFDVVHFRLSLALTAENLGLMIERAISLLSMSAEILSFTKIRKRLRIERKSF
jgi:hypothetical protein